MARGSGRGAAKSASGRGRPCGRAAGGAGAASSSGAAESAVPAPLVVNGSIHLDRQYMESSEDMPAVKGGFLVQFENALEVINGHSLFENISSTEPLPILGTVDSAEDQGVQTPLDQDDFDNAIGSAGLYRCAGNAAWLNIAYRPDPGVPILTTKIDEMIEFWFSEPNLHFPNQIYVAAPSGYKPMEHKGALKSITPCEYIYAFLIKTARDITRGADEETLRRWLGHQCLPSWQFGTTGRLQTASESPWRPVGQKNSIM